MIKFYKKIMEEIEKEDKNMIKIKEKNVKWVSSTADYELENGVLLFSKDWNGEIYGNGFDKENKIETNKEYKPIYKEIAKEEFEIIGFEEL